MAYGNLAGTSIGNLLRMIQEQKGVQPPLPPSTEVGSPIRGVVQQPIQMPESVGTTHVVSVKPEMTPQPSNSPLGGVPTPVGAATGPLRSAPASGMTPSSVAPSVGPTPISATPSPVKVSAPSIGTSIKPSSSLSGMSSPGMQSISPSIAPTTAKAGVAYAGEGQPQTTSAIPSFGQSGAQNIAGVLGQATGNQTLTNYATNPNNRDLLGNAARSVIPYTPPFIGTTINNWLKGLFK